MRTLLLLTALVFHPGQVEASTVNVSLAARVSIRADTDSVVSTRIAEDLASAVSEVARRNGFEQTTTPDGWLELSYLASASAHPDVPSYFTHYAAYAADLAVHMDTMVAEIVTRRFHEAGYSAKDEEELKAAFMRGYNRSREKQRMLYAAMRRQSLIALRLHEFLVKVDARVAASSKDSTLIFAKPLEKRRYDELAMAIDAANEQVAQLSGQAQTTASTQP